MRTKGIRQQLIYLKNEPQDARNQRDCPRRLKLVDSVTPYRERSPPRLGSTGALDVARSLYAASKLG
ncbi:hypothetical protein KCP74_23735 [Salmonella enterica subsp. enterica]|nr:hypothetical protein KCP74_23735 [Salmonella enterica subsp. enterica]